jgi:hypothetical protein
MNKLLEKSLSSEDILQYLNHETSLIPYDYLAKYNNIYEALGPYERVVILYMTKENYGHWCCVWLDKRGICFFDSYGGSPDSQLMHIPEYFRYESGQARPLLTALMYDSGMNVNYSDYELQRMEEGVNTCGRWVCTRLLYPTIEEDTFYKLMTSTDIDPDVLVTLLTINI